MRVRQKTRWRELHLCRLQNNLHTRNANWETPKSNPNRLASQTTKHFERSQNPTQQGIVFLTPPPRNVYHDFNSSQWPSKPNKITDYSSIAVTIRLAIFANRAPQKTGYSSQNPCPSVPQSRPSTKTNPSTRNTFSASSGPDLPRGEFCHANLQMETSITAFRLILDAETKSTIGTLSSNFTAVKGLKSSREKNSRNRDRKHLSLKSANSKRR